MLRINYRAIFFLLCMLSFCPKAESREVTTGLFGLYNWGDWDDAFNVVRDSKFKVAVVLPRAALLDMAQSKGIKCIAGTVLTKEMTDNEVLWQNYLSYLRQIVSILKSHPALFAWYPVDEPDFHNIPIEKIAEIRNTIRAIDKTHPIFSVMASPEKWEKYLPYFDIVSVDPYLGIGLSGVRQKPAKVGTFLDKLNRDLRKLKIKKPVWVTLGAFELIPKVVSQPNLYAKPTPAEFKEMVEISLSKGVDGIMVFSLSIAGGTNFVDWNLPKDDPLLWQAVKELPERVAQ